MSGRTDSAICLPESDFPESDFPAEKPEETAEYNEITKNEKCRDTGFHLKYLLQSCKIVLQPLERENKNEV